MEVELVGDLGGGHRLREILLVGEDEEDGIAELVLGQHAGKLFPSLADPLAVIAVDHEDEAWCVGRLAVSTDAKIRNHTTSSDTQMAGK